MTTLSTTPMKERSSFTIGIPMAEVPSPHLTCISGMEHRSDAGKLETLTCRQDTFF